MHVCLHKPSDAVPILFVSEGHAIDRAYHCWPAAAAGGAISKLPGNHVVDSHHEVEVPHDVWNTSSCVLYRLMSYRPVP